MKNIQAKIKIWGCLIDSLQNKRLADLEAAYSYPEYDSMRDILLAKAAERWKNIVKMTGELEKLKSQAPDLPPPVEVKRLSGADYRQMD